MKASYDLVHGAVEVPGSPEPIQYTASVPDLLLDPRIRLFIPGFGGFKRSSRKVRSALAADQHVVGVSYDPPRYGGTRNDLLDAQKVHYDAVAAIIDDLAENSRLEQALDGRPIDMNQIILLAHSMGGIPATEYAVRHPENVDQLLGVAIVGTEGAVQLGFVPRLWRSAKNEFLPAAGHGQFGGLIGGAVMAKRALRYYGVNLVRTIGEMKSCMEADRRPHLAALGELGVRTALYLPEGDELIPAYSNAAAAHHLVDHIEIALPLNHLAPQLRPRRVAADLVRISCLLDTL